MKIIELSVNEYKEINNMTTDLINKLDEVEEKKFKVGDIMPVKLNTGEEVEIVAIKELEEGMLCTFVDCLHTELPRKNKNFDLEDRLNDTLVDDIPDEILEQMLPVDEDENLFRLFTEKEVFGKNEYGNEELETEQINFFKSRRNRIAFQGKNGGSEWWWLANKCKDYSGAYFARVYGYGDAGSGDAGCSLGVRPAFILKSKICGA